MSKQTKTNIKAILILIILVASIFTIGYAVGADNTRKAEYEEHKQTVAYIVKPNDTLWGIAEEYKPSWQDTREYVYEIQHLNDMDDCNIDIGDKLFLYTDNNIVQYTMSGVYKDGTIITDDGNEWYYDAELDDNTNILVTFSDNNTPNNICDDIIINIEEA